MHAIVEKKSSFKLILFSFTYIRKAVSSWVMNSSPSPGFHTGVENIRGGSSKFDGGGGEGEGLSQYMGELEGGLKFCQKMPVMEFI